MKNFLVTESERIDILKRHRSLLKEQAQNERAVLEAGLNAGCFGTLPIAGGSFGTLKGGQRVYQKPSKNKPGQWVRFLADGTYYFYNPQTKQASQAYKLPKPCEAMTNYGQPVKQDKESEAKISYYKAQTPPYKTLDELVAANEYSPDIRNTSLYDYVKIGNVELFRKKDETSGSMDDVSNPIRAQWTKYLKENGFEINPKDTEKEGLISGRLYDVTKNVPQGVFPPNQMVWFKQNALGLETFGDKQDEVDKDRGECKDIIERFYNEFMRTRGRQVTQTALLQQLKDQAQFCKNRWEGKWGIGGGKFEDMIKVLSGRTSRGPSSSGDDSIFRLQ